MFVLSDKCSISLVYWWMFCTCFVQDGFSPVRIAAESGHVEMTELLIDKYHCLTLLDDVSTYC